jgi:hypothetical protein
MSKIASVPSLAGPPPLRDRPIARTDDAASLCRPANLPTCQPANLLT